MAVLLFLRLSRLGCKLAVPREIGSLQPKTEFIPSNVILPTAIPIFASSPLQNRCLLPEQPASTDLVPFSPSARDGILEIWVKYDENLT